MLIAVIIPNPPIERQMKDEIRKGLRLLRRSRRNGRAKSGSDMKRSKRRNEILKARRNGWLRR